MCYDSGNYYDEDEDDDDLIEDETPEVASPGPEPTVDPEAPWSHLRKLVKSSLKTGTWETSSSGEVEITEIVATDEPPSIRIRIDNWYFTKKDFEQLRDFCIEAIASL